MKTQTTETKTETKTAFSYIRLSSKKQTKGQGVERQTARPEAICKENGWTLSTKTFADLGVSAYTGKNLLKGSLANFIQLAIDKKLPTESVLILEAFDRFSRQDIDESVDAFQNLLKKGVDIHVAFTGKTYTKASLTEIGARIEILLAMKSAYEYSANLSKRTKAAKQAKFAKVDAGQMANINEYTPRWLSYDKETNTMQLNEKAKAVKTIFTDYINGSSLCSIAKKLNDAGVKSLHNSRWRTSTIRHIIGSKSVIGFFRGKKIMPSVVKDDYFNKAQALLEKNKGRRGHRADLVNLFSGYIKCKCGETMHMTKTKNRNYAYFRCAGHSQGLCPESYCVRAELIDVGVIGIVLKKTAEELIAKKSPQLAGQLNDLETLLAKNAKDMAKLLMLDDTMTDDTLKAKYTALTQEKQSLTKDIQGIRATLANVGSMPEAVGNIGKMMPDLDKMTDQLKDIQLREKLKPQLRDIISSIIIDSKLSKMQVRLVSGEVLKELIDEPNR